MILAVKQWNNILIRKKQGDDSNDKNIPRINYPFRRNGSIRCLHHQRTYQPRRRNA